MFPRLFRRRTVRATCRRWTPRLEMLEDRTTPVAHVYTPIGSPSYIPTYDVAYWQISVPVSITPHNVSVTLNIGQPDDSIIGGASLLAPNGQFVDLFYGSDVSGQNLRGTVFDDNASSSISSGTAPYTGVFKPDTPLATLAGAEAQGIWTLFLFGTGISGDLGTWQNWSLTLLDGQDAPDLVPQSFAMTANPVLWGQTVTAQYAVRNQGTQDAGPFNLDVCLSTTNTVDAADPVVTSVRVPGVAAGDVAPGSVTFTLPDTAPQGFVGLTQAYLGLLIDPKQEVPDSNILNNASQNGFCVSSIGPLIASQQSPGNDTWQTAQPFGLPDYVQGNLNSPGGQDFYSLLVTQTGRLTAQVTPGAGSSLLPRLKLLGPSGDELVTSDAWSAQAASADVEQYLPPGRYYLQVSGQAGLSGAYRLETSFTASQMPSEIFAVGASPQSVVVADLNGDGRSDVIAANSTYDEMSVMLGNGDGTCQAVRSYPVDGYPAWVIVADVNGDGIPDVITANSVGNDVSVLLGKGDGTFQPQMTFSVGSNPSSAIVADVNGDGVPDIITTNKGDNTISILPGMGDGTFSSATTVAVGLGPQSVAVADINGDQKPDLVVANSGGTGVSVLLGNGDGTFAPAQSLPVGLYPQSVALMDINGDDRPDIIASLGGYVAVLLNGGNGTFQPEQSYLVGLIPRVMVAADVNGDNCPDLIFGDGMGTQVAILLGNPDHTFLAPEFVNVGYPVTAFGVADMNGDGQLDLVTVNIDGNNGSINLGNGDGTFQTSQRSTVGALPGSLTAADVNRDGKLDLVTANYGDNNVSVLLGNGDGTFQAARSFATGWNPNAVAVADVNGDARPDVITANDYGNGVSVLLGNGDGTFMVPQSFDVGKRPYALAVTDINNDGRLDIVTANSASNDVTVLLGNGDGTFVNAGTFAVGTAPQSVAVADLNGDGSPDIITADNGSDDISVLLGSADGTFGPQQTFAVGKKPESVAVADVNGDGLLDLVTANYGSNDGSLLLGKGDGTFAEETRFDTGLSPDVVLVADVSRDRQSDLVIVRGGALSVSVLQGNGDGTFQSPQVFPVGYGPTSGVVADLNGDGRPDIVTANLLGRDLSVLLNRGDGTFVQQTQTAAVGQFPVSVAIANLPGGGQAEIVTANYYSSDLSVLRGNADGTFAPAATLPLESSPWSAVVADLNQDGRSDIVAVDGNQVSVFLANVDGSFQLPQSYPVDQGPISVVVADVNGDGVPDILTLNSDSVSVLLGKGDGSFKGAQPILLPTAPWAMAVADVNGDGKPDIVTVDGQQTWVLCGNGDGTFQAPYPAFVGYFPWCVAVADVNGDGKADLITGNYFTNDVWVSLSNGDGTFQAPQFYAVGLNPYAVTVADVNGDGLPDIIAANHDSNDISVLMGRGDGIFMDEQRLPAGTAPWSVAVADVNGDGKPEMVTANSGSNDVSIIPWDPSLTFTPSSAAEVDVRQTPLLADLDHDGINDLVVLNDSGMILFRRGLPGGTGLYAPPVFLNSDNPARDIATVNTPGGPAIAACDLQGQTVSLYTYRGLSANAGFLRSVAVTTAAPSQRLAAADLDGNHLDDLILASPENNTISIVLQQPDGSFRLVASVPVGDIPAELSLADVDGDGRPDVIVGNRGSGDICVLFNDARQTFSKIAHYRADASPVASQTVDFRILSSAGNVPVSVLAGSFNKDGRTDLVIVNRGAQNVTTLLGTPGGGFTNPMPGQTFAISNGTQTRERPGQSVTADFDGDGKLDLAILMEDLGQVWVYRGNGDGSFTFETSIPAGSAPTGLAVADINGDGIPDLMVGNGFGDVLFIPGNGDGTFRSFVHTDQRVPFVVTDANGDVVLANQAEDAALALTRNPDNTFTPAAFQQGRDDGLIGPGAVVQADLNGDGLPDLVLANSGSNNVLAYLGQPNGSFSNTPLSFCTGTNPVALSVADLNGDGLPDLVVANQGSNDVSVLVGALVDGSWTLQEGPRLQTGGHGPNAVSVQDVTGPQSIPDGIPDILVTNGQEGTMAVLPGIGQGFFNDVQPTVQKIGTGEPVTQTDVVGPTQVLALNQSGEFTSYNPETGNAVSLHTSPLTQQVRAFEAVLVANNQPPLLFAGVPGAIQVLNSTDGTNYTVAQTVSVPALFSPSALQVLSLGSDQFEVFATNAGQSQAFVFTLSLKPGGGVEPPPIVPPLPPFPTPQPEQPTQPGQPETALPVPIGLPQSPISEAGVLTELVPVGSALVFVVTLMTAFPMQANPPLIEPALPVECLAPIDVGFLHQLDAGLYANGTPASGAMLLTIEQLLASVLTSVTTTDRSEVIPVVTETGAHRPQTLEQFLVGVRQALEHLGWMERGDAQSILSGDDMSIPPAMPAGPTPSMRPHDGQQSFKFGKRGKDGQRQSTKVIDCHFSHGWRKAAMEDTNAAQSWTNVIDKAFLPDNLRSLPSAITSEPVFASREAQATSTGAVAERYGAGAEWIAAAALLAPGIWVSAADGGSLEGPVREPRGVRAHHPRLRNGTTS